ncbi:DUF4126 domain-containing protein [Telmatobacter sp. DSM 110680]|uniref:DUF4126 domain-containing protein n=1 Tax=Telmatobacter sp. DSM 110680 TaxID=3036704 RepID=A0AAU7DLV7_9BACT
MRVPLACAFMLGVVSGSRSLLAPAVVSRAIRGGTVRVEGTPFAFLEGRSLNHLLVGLAFAEVVADKLPMTPSRKAAFAYTGRIVTGALAGAAIGSHSKRVSLGVLLGMAGAVVGTEGGAAFRSWLASLFERDLPAAVIEDLVTFALVGFVNSKLKKCALPSAAL